MVDEAHALDEIEAAIVAFATAHDGQIASILPLLDELAGAHPLAPEALVATVDAAFERLYRAGRAWFAGHRWTSAAPTSVAGFLRGRSAELRCDPATRTWAWIDKAWTENITVR